MDGQLGALTGTLFISNDPPTFAIGRLADQSMWFGIRFGVDLGSSRRFVIGFASSASRAGRTASR